MEKKNAKELPKKYYARHMNCGLAGYEDEILLVSTETMKSMCKSFENKPVFVEHNSDIAVEEVEGEAAGYVTKCFYNEMDGWLWVEMLVISDEGQEVIKKGWSVSNAYLPTKSGQAGTCHDIPYDREILEAEFTHLAIVPNPRYEEATIMTPEEFKAYQAEKSVKMNEIKNSKTQKKDTIMLWRKKEIENAESMQDVMFTLKDGTSKSIREMVEIVENACKKNESEEELDMSRTVKANGSDVSISDLVSAYENMKKNESESEKDKEEEKEAAKKNESEEDKKEEKDKENSKDDTSKSKFEEIINASNKGDVQLPKIDTIQAQLERGKKY